MMVFFTKQEANAQNAKVWVKISDPNDVPYFNTDGSLQSNNVVFNQQIQLLGIYDSRLALPASKKTELQKVYQLTCQCSITELETSLNNNVAAVSGVYKAPVYDTLHTPNDYQLVQGINNYALNLINAQQAWDITKGDSNVILAISDQDYSANHSELVGKYVHLYQGGATPTHGNAVSILAAGSTNNNNGLSSIGYNCRLGLYGMNYNEMLVAAYAGARVINMSWTSGCFYNPYEQLCVNEAYEAGAFLIVAAGNGMICGGPSGYLYPASYDHVFSVTSVGQNDNHMQFPNDTINTHQHNDKVDLSAPGYGVAVNPFEGWFINSSGTSYAAPIVTGTVGLMLSVNPCLSRKDIDTILRLSAANIDSVNPLFIGKLGAGRLDAYAAVQMSQVWATQPMSVLLQPVNAFAPPGGTVQYMVSSTSSLPLYQWQRDSSGIFVNLINNATYSGVKTNTLTVSNAGLLLNNTNYRCVMTSGYCQVTSNAASLQINSNVVLPDAAGPINLPAVICFSDTIILSVDSVNNATGYNWVVNGNSTIVSGQNTTSVTVFVVDTAFSVTVTPTNSYGSGVSTTIPVSTGPFATGSFAGGASVCAGDSAILTLNLTGNSPWTGLINGSIPFSSATSPVQITVSPNSTTDYILTSLSAGSCPAFPDYFSTMATVVVLPQVLDTSHVVVCSNQLPYQWHGLSLNSSGFYNDTVVVAGGCDTVSILHLTVIGGNVPNAPSALTQALVSNQCHQRVYRYIAAITPNALGYQWNIPTSCGGVGPVTVDSGDINSSRIIKLKYYSNQAAWATDSIKVAAYNSCGTGPYKAAKLINATLNVPSTPASITVAPLVTNVCGQRKYRYTAPDLPLGNNTTTPATGYIWSFTSPMPLQAQLDSGTLNSKIIVVRYLSNMAAAPGDSIRLVYTSACGNSLQRKLKINIAALNAPPAPSSISITPLVTNVCGQRKYRLIMPAASSPSINTASANGYEWVITGNAAQNMLIDSGSLASRIVVIIYTSNMATSVGDSIKGRYTSDCGPGTFRALKFSAPNLNPPSAPAYIQITAVAPSVCGSRIYRYTAPPLTTGTSTIAPANGYVWSLTGILGANASIDSGSLNSQVIRIKYFSNAAALTGDSIRLRYNSACGLGTIRANKLTNTVLYGCPPLTAKANLMIAETKIFPNPFSGSIQVIVGEEFQHDIIATITDQAGRRLERQDLRRPSKFEMGKYLLPGIYWLIIENKKNKKVFKIVKGG